MCIYDSVRNYYVERPSAMKRSACIRSMNNSSTLFSRPQIPGCRNRDQTPPPSSGSLVHTATTFGVYVVPSFTRRFTQVEIQSGDYLCDSERSSSPTSAARRFGCAGGGPEGGAPARPNRSPAQDGSLRERGGVTFVGDKWQVGRRAGRGLRVAP